MNMRTKWVTLTTLALILCSTRMQANIVGYVNTPFAPGQALFANPLQNATNKLSVLFGSNVPNFTTVSLWNSATLTYDVTSIYYDGDWDLDLTLNPGTGALLTTSGSFTNTFVGEALNHDGTPLPFNGATPPPVYGGPNGLFLLGDKAPVGASGNDIFLNLFGRAPVVGEQVIKLSSTSTYQGGGLWDFTPTLNVGEAAFFNIGPVPVPEPTMMSLTLLGGVLLCAVRRRRK